MKALQINTVVNSGSTGRIAEDIGNTLIGRGFESYIAFGRNNRPSSSKKIKIGSKTDVYWHGLETLLFDKHGLSSVRATNKLVKTLHRIQPDIIGLHNLHGYYLNYPILFQYIKATNTPVIWTFHDCWPFTGHCTYFERTQCEKWKTHCGNCPCKDQYPKSFVDRSFGNFENKKEAFLGVNNLCIVTPSHWLRGLVKQSFLKDYDLKVVHNGIDLHRFKPILEKFSKDKNIVLGVASTWDERKGLKDFLRLRKILPVEYKIVLIGLTQQQIKTLPPNVLGIERTENIEELVAWYNRADVFVNPTYMDNFPTTNIESLACGTPVITYDTGGSPEALSPQTGEVVAKGDIPALRDAVLKWANNNDAAAACRQRAEDNFDRDDRYNDYIKIYQSLSESKGNDNLRYQMEIDQKAI